MITETRESRARLLQYSERRLRRRHHTLDNATLDKFNFVCIPLRFDEGHTKPSSSPSNVVVTSSKDFPGSNPIELSSPSRRVRFKFDKIDQNTAKHEQQLCSLDNDRLPNKYTVHRVEFQIPVRQNVNPWLNVDCVSTPAKTRSITSKKIDINYSNNHLIQPQCMTSFVDSAIVRRNK